MKYVPNPELGLVSSALSFNGVGCRVEGSCDLYITNLSWDQKKEVQSIENSLQTEYNSLLNWAISLGDSQEYGPSPYQLSRPSPFGSLSETRNRREFANLILGMNVSHGSDYDFAQSLEPNDFTRESSLQDVMDTVNRAIRGVQPNYALPQRPCRSLPWVCKAGSMIGWYRWDPSMWNVVDRHIDLHHCKVFSLPSSAVFGGEGGIAWSHHFFFYNKAKGRMCYLFLKGLSITNPLDTIPGSPFSDTLSSLGEDNWRSVFPVSVPNEDSWDEDDLNEMVARSSMVRYYYKPIQHTRRNDFARRISNGAKSSQSRSRSRSPVSSRTIRNRASKDAPLSPGSPSAKRSRGNKKRTTAVPGETIAGA